jgi:NLI interacting factor-like phosphatase
MICWACRSFLHMHVAWIPTHFSVSSAEAGKSGEVVNSGTCRESQTPRHHPPHYVPNYQGFHQHNGAALQAATEDPASGKLTCSPVGPSHHSTQGASSSATLSTPCIPTQHTLSVDTAISATSGAASTIPSRASEDCSTSRSNMHHRLYRGSCVRFSGSYIKDLSRLGRPLERTVIVDNSPASYMWNPDSAIPSVSYIDDKEDDGLLKILEVLMLLKASPDVRVDLPGARAAANYRVPVC